MTQHRISDVDPERRLGNCLVCGPVSVSRRSRRWQCRNKRREERARDRRQHPAWWDELYRALLEEQQGRCAICSKEGPLAMDHDHSCSCSRGCRKCIRGLLCIRCNTGIGKLGDSPEGLRRALAYLEERRTPRV